MKKNLFLAGVLIIGLVSCKKQDNTEETQNSTEFVNEHTAQKSLDWTGEYKGVLPCADCEGIEITITLNPDETFYVKQEYLTENNNVAVESNGYFSWDKTGFIVTIEGSEEFRRSFKVVENALIYLDNGRSEVKGKTAELYRLTKQ